jgi:hypothetical protein
MDEAKRRAVKFLEKEIKTYVALASFFSKQGIKERLRVGGKSVVISPTYYKERVREATKLVNELKKTELKPCHTVPRVTTGRCTQRGG